MSWGPKVRSLNSSVRDVPSRPDLLQQIHATPVITEYARGCLWERAVYENMTGWFEAVRSAGFHAGLGMVCMHKQRLVARVKLDHRHQQPAGLLHGGFSALIAEELGSVATAINVHPKNILGVNVQATHMASAKVGEVVIAVCTPVKRHGNLQVWAINLYIDEEQTAESAAFTTDPVYHLNLVPKGLHLATCQLTVMARAAATKKPATAVAAAAQDEESSASPSAPRSKL